ncbi:MAG TPA: RNA-binding protein [Candidatus Nanoarchaeia archaeon]|nr:RNA-binding protein [Candidatus Nanoarchaeia archaeon]
MSKKLFVGNLPFTMSNDKLREMFASYGEMDEVVIISDKFSGKSKGFGFVNFKEDASADKAIAELNGKDCEGRAMTVSEARPMDPNAPRPARRGGFGGGFGGGRGGGFGGRSGGFGGGRERRF